MSINWIDILDQTVASNYKIPMANQLTLTESNSNCSCKTVTIKGTGRAYALSLDNNAKDPFPFFGNKGGISKKNDGILFCEREGKLHVFIMELKSNYPKEGIPQLKAATYFVKFLIDCIRLVHWEFPLFPEQCELKYIIFNTDSRKNVQKRIDRKSEKITYQKQSGLDVAFVKCDPIHSLDSFL